MVEALGSLSPWLFYRIVWVCCSLCLSLFVVVVAVVFGSSLYFSHCQFDSTLLLVAVSLSVRVANRSLIGVAVSFTLLLDLQLPTNTTSRHPSIFHPLPRRRFCGFAHQYRKLLASIRLATVSIAKFCTSPVQLRLLLRVLARLSSLCLHLNSLHSVHSRCHTLSSDASPPSIVIMSAATSEITQAIQKGNESDVKKVRYMDKRLDGFEYVIMMRVSSYTNHHS
jgi:hypothetical protein